MKPAIPFELSKMQVLILSCCWEEMAIGTPWLEEKSVLGYKLKECQTFLQNSALLMTIWDLQTKFEPKKSIDFRQDFRISV